MSFLISSDRLERKNHSSREDWDHFKCLKIKIVSELSKKKFLIKSSTLRYLTEANARSDEFESGPAPDAASAVEHGIAAVLDEVTVFGRLKFRAGHQLARTVAGVLVAARTLAVPHRRAARLRDVVFVRTSFARAQVARSALGPICSTRTRWSHP